MALRELVQKIKGKFTKKKEPVLEAKLTPKGEQKIKEIAEQEEEMPSIKKKGFLVNLPYIF